MSELEKAPPKRRMFCERDVRLNQGPEVPFARRTRICAVSDKIEKAARVQLPPPTAKSVRPVSRVLVDQLLVVLAPIALPPPAVGPFVGGLHCDALDGPLL